MALVHVLEKSDTHYRVVIHKPVPAGSNNAGFTWKNVILGAGLNTTAMVEGALPGQISTAEKATIIAGDVFEVVLSLPLFSGGTSTGQVAAIINESYDQRIQDLQERYGQWGRAQG